MNSLWTQPDSPQRHDQIHLRIPIPLNRPKKETKDTVEVSLGSRNRTYLCTGGGQQFVRTYSKQVYGIMADQIIRTAVETEFEYDKSGKAVLFRKKSLLSTTIRQPSPRISSFSWASAPHAAFGNSGGAPQMLEYTQCVE